MHIPTPITCAANLKALHAEKAEVLVKLSLGKYLLGLAEVVFEGSLYLLSATKQEDRINSGLYVVCCL